jgi:hypothetical protein
MSDVGLGCLEPTHSDNLAIDQLCQSLVIESNPIPPTLGTGQWLHVNNQGRYNSCCGHAVDMSLQWSRLADMDYSGTPENLSARFSYLAGQEWAGVLGRGDNGLSIEAGVMAANETGAVLEEECPYWQGGESIDSTIEPWRARAKRHRVRSVSRIASVDDVVQALGQGIGATVFGMTWHTGHGQYRGGVLTRNPGGMRLGGHAVCAVDYRNGGEIIEIQNSHGIQFGERGRMLVSAEYFQQLLTEPFGAYVVSGVQGFAPRPYLFRGFMA